jgi:uncharacterized membrane protein YcaP (DUF421 family)
MWFDGWSDLWHVLIVGTAAYVTLVVVLRLSGKRTLAKLNAFDLVVTVALGSTLATILLDPSIAWMEGAFAFGLLAALQFLVAALSRRVRRGREVVTARPTLLLRDGRPLEDALRKQRVTLDEVRQAVRSSGRGGLGDVAAVVLETDGTMSVIPESSCGDRRALEGVD